MLQASPFFGGVPLSILYDNTVLAVAKILGDGTRKRTRIFSELQPHYLFEDRYGRPGKGNDKGTVEGVIGFGRRNFQVLMPRLDLDCYPYLPRARVEITKPWSYLSLMSATAA